MTAAERNAPPPAEGISRRSAREIVPLVMAWVRPQRVLDLGCGKGDWLKVFAEAGAETLGVDGEWTRAILRIPEDRFIAHDLRRPFRLDRPFDLAVSVEVAEHLPPEAAGTLVESLTGLAPVVLFSAAIPFQGGREHLNEQWPEYWIAHFRQRGFVVVDAIRRRVWQNRNVAWWYAQNILLYVREDRLEAYPALAEEAARNVPSQFALVHPTKYSAIADPRNVPLGRALAALPTIIAHEVRRMVDHRLRGRRPPLILEHPRRG